MRGLVLHDPCERRSEVGAEPQQTQVQIPAELYGLVPELFAERARLQSGMEIPPGQELEYQNEATAQAIKILIERRKDETHGHSHPPHA